MLTLNDGRSELWQWDTCRTLDVDADCSQVHFSNKVFGRSIDVDVIDGVAIIPDILLQTDKDLNVWAFVGTAENGYTKISKTFKVNRRNKPADYVFTPPEQTSLEEIKEKIEYLESNQDPDAIKNAVEDYLEKNPVEAPVQSVNGKTGTVELTAEDVGAISNETDPTVPAWAKQPTKPTYTAAEVGALPNTYTLPAATETTLGGVKAAAATDDMTQPVGITADGKLVTAPSPDSGGNADYNLPVATAETLGGVMPVAKTEAMTQPVGVDANGALYTEPGKGGGSDYVLPIGGAELGGVKNGGNVTINADGTMTAPENEISGEQVSNAVSEWLDEHPEATTTVADRSINPDKTTWMRQVFHNIFDPNDPDLMDGYYYFTELNANTIGGGTANYFVSGYIPVTAGRQYYINGNVHLKFFDEVKKFLSTGNSKNVPDGASYMRFSVSKNLLTPDTTQVYENIGETWEYDTYKNLYSIVITDTGYSKAVADMVEGKFLDGSLAPVDLFADESLRYKQMKGMDEFHWNIVDPSTIEKGGINSKGEEVATPSMAYKYFGRSGYVPVTPGEELHYLWMSLFGYDADKNFVGELSNSGGVAVVPEGVYFVRGYAYGNNGEITRMNVLRRGYGKYDLKFDSSYGYEHGFPVFKDEDSKEGFKNYLGIYPWTGKNFGIIGDSFTAPGTWCTIMVENLQAVNCWNKAVSGANFGDADGVPKTAYEQAQEFVADGKTLDVILITMGTNDAGNSRTMGEIVESNNISDFDLTTYTGGMQACLNYLQNNFPNAIIYVGWTPMGGLVNGTKAEYITRMQDVCLMYGVEYIETRTCGVTRFSDVYADCYEMGVNGGHPTGKGQNKIGEYMTRLMKSKL